MQTSWLRFLLLWVSWLLTLAAGPCKPMVAGATMNRNCSAPPLGRAALFRVLVDAIQSRTCVLAALGLNKANLEDKVSALFYSIWLETGSERIQTFLDSVVSVTRDLGVESGISEFNALIVQSLLLE